MSRGRHVLESNGGRARRKAGQAAVAVALLVAVAGLPGSGEAQVTPGTEPIGGMGQASNIQLVGHNNLGGAGLNGDVAISGNTAIVGAGYVPMNTMQTANTKFAADNNAPPCATVPVKVVDLSDPAKPQVAATIPVPAGQAVPDVDVLRVSTPKFRGDLAAIAYASCDYDQETFRERGVVLTGSFAHRGVAYYDVTNPSEPRFISRYMSDAENVDPASPPCGRPPAGADNRCAQDIFSVELKRTRDGRVLTLASRPDGADRNTPFTDVRILDTTDPANPVQVGTWPPLGDAPPRTSNLGCYPRSGSRNPRFNPDATKVLVPYLDGGMFVLDVTDLANPEQLGQWSFPDDWSVEGQAAHVAPAQLAGRELALVAEEDIWWPRSAFRVGSPASIAGDKVGCSDLFTSADQKFVSQIFRHPGGQVPGELAYVGRGCPARSPAPPTVIPPDPYLTDPRGKLLFADDNINPATQPTLNATACTFNSRVRRAMDAGALGVVLITRNPIPFSIAGFPPTGSPREATDQNGALTGDVSIPGFQVNQPAGFAIRSVLCPSFTPGATANTGTCTGGQPVTGALVDLPGEWGGLRMIDYTSPAAPSEVAYFKSSRSRQMPPPDYRGLYSVHHAVVENDRAYVAWNSDGLRVLDLGSGVPAEIASFVPPDTPDPTGTVPAKARVVGVAYTATHIVISDLNSGLYVLEKPAPFGGRGYWMAGADGGVFAMGDAPFLGSVPRVSSPIVGIVPTSTGKGYWLVGADGGVFAFGDAPFRGSTGGRRLNAPMVALVPTRTNQGYWLVAADGGVFAFGDASFFGSTGGIKLTQPIVGATPAATGGGYTLAAADGGVFAFGDANFYGSTANIRLNRPIVAMASTVSGRGYWLTASDGGVFAFGNARFAGSTGGLRLAEPIVGMAPVANSSGYWLAAADGGVFALNAPFFGSLGGVRLASRIVSVAAVPR
ncbi:MAG: hypothetical protein ACRD0N_13395 [Acidimicrobiales bacterium]